MLSKIDEIGAERQQRGKVLGALLNVGWNDLERNYWKVGEGTSIYETERNYQTLVDFLKEIGLNALAKRVLMGMNIPEKKK
ncbi:MAG: hypothetical protein EOP48_23950 [Sphingobacteriales bacterium]|nr:MAG: hypothetical protein EOP48_23950 [Sphingobacteriales bacterium]